MASSLDAHNTNNPVGYGYERIPSEIPCLNLFFDLRANSSKAVGWIPDPKKSEHEIAFQYFNHKKSVWIRLGGPSSTWPLMADKKFYDFCRIFLIYCHASRNDNIHE
jgi:hypothetical protein